jgi:hypothetical protein
MEAAVMADVNLLNFSLGGFHLHLTRKQEPQFGIAQPSIPPGWDPLYDVERQFDDEGNIVVYMMVKEQGRPDGQPGPWYVNAVNPKYWITALDLIGRRKSGKDAGWFEPSVRVE